VAVAYLGYSLMTEKQANEDMMELAALEKTEMENEYQQFADQYSEMKSRINNDSIIAQLTREQQRTQELLEELRKTKSDDAAEITRLKKELATVRAVLRSYVLQIDSLNQVNAELLDENNRVRTELEQSNQQNQELASSNMTLSEKVAIASQLNAAGINLIMLDKKGKATEKMKKAKQLKVSFKIAKNVTATNGVRTLYVRITTPAGTVLGNAGTFQYENRQLQCSMKKGVEYGGNETPVTLYYDINQFLDEGNYQVSIFADGQMIGSKSVRFE
jgi:myosin heavy subunit